MKKIIAVIISILIIVTFTACGKSEATKATENLINSISDVSIDSESSILEAEKAFADLTADEKAKVKNSEDLATARSTFNSLRAELLVGKWFNLNDGDCYEFMSDGTGKHDDIELNYNYSDGLVVNIKEGINSSQVRSMTLDRTGEYTKLTVNESGTEITYLSEEDYLIVAPKVKAENIKILCSAPSWKSTKVPGYIIANQPTDDNSGTGKILIGPKLLEIAATWEMLDNNTVKFRFNFGTPYQTILDIVNNNGDYELRNSSGEVLYTPQAS